MSDSSKRCYGFPHELHRKSSKWRGGAAAGNQISGRNGSQRRDARCAAGERSVPSSRFEVRQTEAALAKGLRSQSWSLRQRRTKEIVNTVFAMWSAAVLGRSNAERQAALELFECDHKHSHCCARDGRAPARHRHQPTLHDTPRQESIRDVILFPQLEPK